MPEKYVKDWNELANADAKWSIVSDPSKKYDQWDDIEFFKTGEEDIKAFMEKINVSGLTVDKNEALDFGCGIGRLSNALSKYYKKVFGIDISDKMISDAKKIHKKNENIKFIKNTEPDLKIFEDEKFDLIYSLIVLQHIPKKKLIKSFLKEFIRISKKGGIIFFQLPSIKNRSYLFDNLLQIRGKIYHLAIKAGFSRQFCFKTLNLSPYMYMNYISSTEILSLFSEKCQLLNIDHEKSENTSYIFRKI